MVYVAIRLLKKDKIYYHDMANQEIQARREGTRIPVGMGGYLHDYVPFYFAPRSPMLYYLKKQKSTQNDIVYFMTNIKTINQYALSYVFTDAHAFED